MKKLLPALTLICISSTAIAEQYSPANPVVRPLTLVDGELQLVGALSYGEEANGEKSWDFDANVRYGITDDLTLGFGGLRYRFMERPGNGTGLELTAGLAVKGYLEYSDPELDDSVALGMDITGQYVINKNLAVTFASEYMVWNEEKLENKSEFRHSIGFKTNVAPSITLWSNYTYRDLRDFTQDDAHAVAAGINYNLSRQTDVGLFANYTDFDAAKNGYKADDIQEKGIGAYISYRF